MAKSFTVPRGFALVPIQPTEAMLDAIAGTSWGSLSPSKQAAEIAAWRQLLTAAERAVDAAGVTPCCPPGEPHAFDCPNGVPEVPAARPVNGIPATLRHDEGAVAQCFYCRRYTLDPKALSDRQPTCECGKKEGWSGSFKKPGPDAKWSGRAPGLDLPDGAKR